jgi:hypothetical protein
MKSEVCYRTEAAVFCMYFSFLPQKEKQSLASSLAATSAMLPHTNPEKKVSRVKTTMAEAALETRMVWEIGEAEMDY